jgi:hypothetical protein
MTVPTPIRESALEMALVRAVQAAGHYCRKWTSPGHRSVPDRIVIARGRVHFVELKAPGKHPTADQLREHERIAAAGGVVWVIDSLDGVAHFVEGLG